MFTLNVLIIIVTVVLADNKHINYFGSGSSQSRNVFGSSDSFESHIERQSSYEKIYDNLNVAGAMSSSTVNSKTVRDYEDAFRIQGTASFRSPITENNKRNVNTDQIQSYINVHENTASEQQSQLEQPKPNLKYNKQTQKQTGPVISSLYPYSRYNVELLSTTDKTFIDPESFQIRDSDSKYENKKRLEENNRKFNYPAPLKNPAFLNTLTRIDEVSEDRISDSNTARYGTSDFRFDESSTDQASNHDVNDNQAWLQPNNRNELKDVQFINTLTRIDNNATDHNLDVLPRLKTAINTKTGYKQTYNLMKSQLEVGDQNNNPQVFNTKRTMFIPSEESGSKNFPKAIIRNTDRTYVTVEVVPLVQYYNDSDGGRFVMAEVTKEKPGAAPLATFAAGCIPGKVRVFEICVPKD